MHIYNRLRYWKSNIMKEQKNISGLSSTMKVIALGAIVKFAIHLYYAPEYGFFR
jgi:hypothetical protein